MSPLSVNGTLRDHYRFSDCSRRAVRRAARRHKWRCLEPATRPFCGNGLVEGAEECDCGMDVECREVDRCCDCLSATRLVDAKCPCASKHDCTCGVLGRCVGNSCHAVECAVLQLRECECTPHNGSCRTCCQLSAGDCLTAADAALRLAQQGAFTLQQLEQMDGVLSESRGTAETEEEVQLCSARGGGCVQLHFRLWPTGGPCVSRGHVGLCSLRGCHTQHLRLQDVCPWDGCHEVPATCSLDLIACDGGVLAASGVEAVRCQSGAVAGRSDGGGDSGGKGTCGSCGHDPHPGEQGCILAVPSSRASDSAPQCATRMAEWLTSSALLAR
ncbi:disintegrin and metalloproteinase domain-containing protein 10-like [Schistocerca serialis cubense]|uniref:disintegrin and metalloproteinase domain-containing protein 10-like n=1 Tax=Schistocerca serialis cubense TaxID=2023355 RepID=UPI00214E6AF2|nr:disintegrin and metalloproteinase domain-containing protein 10-like [Schistocerca serialis cubense]